MVVGYKCNGMTEGTVVLCGVGFQPSGARGTPFANHCSLQTRLSDVRISQGIDVYFVTICPHTHKIIIILLRLPLLSLYQIIDKNSRYSDVMIGHPRDRGWFDSWLGQDFFSSSPSVQTGSGRPCNSLHGGYRRPFPRR